MHVVGNAVADQAMQPSVEASVDKILNVMNNAYILYEIRFSFNKNWSRPSQPSLRRLSDIKETHLPLPESLGAL